MVQDLVTITVFGRVEFGVGEGGDFIDEVFEACEAVRAVPGGVGDGRGVIGREAEVLGADSVGGAVVVGCLWVGPDVRVLPLEGIVVEAGGEGDGLGEFAVF